MNATILVVCYKSKTLSNGEHPLMLRIIKNRKISYKSLKISVDAKYWDFEKSEPKSNCPNKDLINKIIGIVPGSFLLAPSFVIPLNVSL